MSSSWVPSSDFSPLWMTTMRSASRTVESRWATTREVRPEETPQTLLDQPFAGGVDTGGGLVKNQNLRIEGNRTGKGDELPFAHREINSPLPHLLIKPFPGGAR